MKTYFNEKSKLFAVSNEKTVWSINPQKTKVLKQFPVEHFDVENWSEVENLTTFDKMKKTFDIFQSMTKKRLLEIEKLREKRSENKKQITVREFLQIEMQKKYHDKLLSLASALPSMGYSMGARYIVTLHNLTACYSDCEEYARSSKFRATHGYFNLKIDIDTFKNSENIGGLFTYIYPNQKQSAKKCWWYEKTGEKQYYSLKKVTGYICGDFHSTTKEGAKNGWKKVCENQKKTEQLKKLREIQEKAKTQDWKKTFAKQLRYQYSYSDSLKVNCEDGTKAFIMRCKLDSTKKYRGSFLLNIATEKSTNSIPFVKRMIEFKAIN